MRGLSERANSTSQRLNCNTAGRLGDPETRGARMVPFARLSADPGAAHRQFGVRPWFLSTTSTTKLRIVWD